MVKLRFEPRLTLLYTPMRQVIKRHPIFHPFIPAKSHHPQTKCSVSVCGLRQVMRIMVKLGASVDKGVDKEDLRAKVITGDPNQDSRRRVICLQ